MKRAIFGLAFLTVFSFCLSAYAQDSEYVENPTQDGGRIVGDRKYFGKDYIVKNPRAALPEPKGVPFAKMGRRPPAWVDSTQEECEGWTEDQRVTFSELTPYSPRIAVSRDTIHVVWEQWYEVFYKRSVDGGITWSDSIALSLIDTYGSFMQDIAVEHNDVYVVWAKASSEQDQGIYFRKSTDGGTSWGSISPIALAGPDYYGLYRPTITVKDSMVFVVYQKHINGHHCLRLKRSLNWGETWSGEISVSERGADGISPKVIHNYAGLYVVHGSGIIIWCNRSTNWGDSWSDDIFISDMDSSIAQWPSIGADDNGGIYITWFDYRYSPYGWTGDIFLRRSIDNGESWDFIVILTDNHLCIESDVCADMSSVHVVWHDERHNMGDANVEIYHRRSTNLGATWLEETRLTDAPYQSGDPRITKENNKLYMVWVDNRHEPDPQAIYFKKGAWYYPGDANGDKTVNLADAVYLVNFLFIGGPPPNAYQAGDANGDDEVNLADVVYLINYLFIYGPAPQCGE